MRMRTDIMYTCEICGSSFSEYKHALKCESACLGLTDVEYKEYCELLKKERHTSGMLYYVSNESTRKAADDAIDKVIKFREEHNMQEDIEGYF